jgi:SAM-dependent methyltransferase
MSSTSGSTSEHFDELAARYAELRVSDGLPDPDELRGLRVLDVGCGPGATVRHLVESDAVGVDSSERMIEVARAAGGEFRVGRAEALPFDDASFDVLLMRMVVHLLDRPRAFAEAVRVLRRGGRLVITTSEPTAAFWATRYFPSFEAIERARFPTSAVLEDELRAAGVAETRSETFVLRRSFSRDEVLAKFRGRAYSTFALIGEDEYEAGLAAAEAEVPERIEYEWHALRVVALA